MFEAYQVTVILRSGESMQGFSPRMIPDEGRILFAPRQDALMTGEAQLAETRVVRFSRVDDSAPDAIAALPDGNALKIVFADGEVLVGHACPIPFGGGLWMRPDGHARDHLLLFVPDGSASAVDWVMGKPRGTERLPPPPVVASPVDPSAEGESASASPIHTDPHEHETAVELAIMDATALAHGRAARERVELAATAESPHRSPNPPSIETAKIQAPGFPENSTLDGVRPEPPAGTADPDSVLDREFPPDPGFSEDATMGSDRVPLPSVKRERNGSADTVPTNVAEVKKARAKSSPAVTDTAVTPAKTPKPR